MSDRDDEREVARIEWRRWDVEGRDRCRLERTRSGWSLTGEASFDHDGASASLAYRVSCDARWQTIDGVVTGTIGSRCFDVAIQRSGAGWTKNGEAAPAAADCVDLDLGFTPATNLFQIRRLALPVGAAADAPVAWLDVESTRIERLDQRYERRTARSYWYEAPRFGYAALLDVRADGFIVSYPDLWTAVDG